MNKPFEADRFKALHGGKLRDLFLIYQSNKPFCKSWYFWTALILSVFTVAFVFLTGVDAYNTIAFSAEMIIGIMPDILGFNLGAYVLLIGLNSQNILEDITIPVENESYSLFQKMSSVFAVSILVQASSLVFSYFATTTMEIGKNIMIDGLIGNVVNGITLLTLSFLAYYAVVLIGRIVLNIFGFGQLLHFYIVLERKMREMRQRTDAKED